MQFHKADFNLFAIFIALVIQSDIKNKLAIKMLERLLYKQSFGLHLKFTLTYFVKFLYIAQNGEFETNSSKDSVSFPSSLRFRFYLLCQPHLLPLVPPGRNVDGVQNCQFAA